MNSQIFPFLSWIGKLKNKKILKQEILAGITVSFVLIPQSMAYAGLAGLPVNIGLYSAFIPVIIASMFSYSPKMISSSITIMSLMTFTILSTFAIPGSHEYIVYASMMTFFVGLIYIFLGKLRLGIIVNYLSHPVTIGFTNAAALITITSQIPKIFGVEKGVGDNFIYQIINLLQNIVSDTNMYALTFGMGSIIFLIIGKKISSKIPIVLFLLLFSIVFSYLYGYNENYGGKIIGEIPQGFPHFSVSFISESIRYLDFFKLAELFIFSGLIALIGFTQTVSVAKYLSYTQQSKMLPNKELIGQGIANVSSSFFGGYSIAGSLSRSALNIRAGATTGLSGIVAGCMVGLTLLFLTPVLYYLPVSTLGAIIIIAVWQMIQFKPLIKAWKIEKQDAIVGIITFIITFLSLPNIEIGIAFGVFLSLVLYMYRSMKPKIVELGFYVDGTYRDVKLFGLKTSKHIGVYRFDGNLFFGNCSQFEQGVLNLIADKTNLKYVILDFEWVNDIDSTAEKTIVSLTRQLKKNKIKVYISGVRTRVFNKLNISKFFKNFGEDYFSTDISDALDIIEKKEGKNINTRPLRKYKKDKNKDPLLEKNIIKKIEKIGI